MAYIPLNQIVDAIDDLDSQQKQILLGILQDTYAKEVGITLQTSFEWRHKILHVFIRN